MAIFWGHFHTHFATFTSNKTNILQHSDTKIFKNIDQSVTIQQPKAFFTVLFIIKNIKCFAPKNENRPILEKCSYILCMYIMMIFSFFFFYIWWKFPDYHVQQ